MNTATNTVSFEYSVTRDGHFSHPFHGFGECEVTLTLSAYVSQDSGHGFVDKSEFCVVWSDESLATIARYGFDVEELDGAIEHAEEAFLSSEQDQCRLASARQRQDSARGAA